jgi:thiol-disulfide isomerase/thioredoxin
VPYLITAVLVVGALCTLDLLLTVGVIRRLREHTELLASPYGALKDAIIGVGEAPHDFSALATDGTPVRFSATDGPTLVAFFSPNCQACKQKLPDFLAAAARFPGGPERVLAVVARDGGDMEALATTLADVARVVVETDQPVVTEAFRVKAFPAWALVDGGTVRESGVGLDTLPVAVAV